MLVYLEWLWNLESMLLVVLVFCCLILCFFLCFLIFLYLDLVGIWFFYICCLFLCLLLCWLRFYLCRILLIGSRFFWSLFYGSVGGCGFIVCIFGF